MQIIRCTLKKILGNKLPSITSLVRIMRLLSPVLIRKKSEVTQSCLTLYDPMDCSPPGSCVHGIFQARILEGVVISLSGDLPNPGIEPGSPTMQADSIPSELPGKPVLINLLKRICSKSGLIFEAKSENISKIYKHRIKILK